ncbi:MAG: ABC transporter permease [Desulfovibrio sp.]|nr:MAG: ABC transporter permease [Desulfovibrio sp.]
MAEPGGRPARRFSGRMRRFLVRLLWMAVVLWGITVVSFGVIHLAPGTASDVQAGLNPTAGDGARERLTELYGLDQPLHVQYWSWLSRMVRFDFGQSLSGDRRPVWERISERLPLTFGMNAAALVLTLLIAVPIGAYSAARQGGLFDRAATVLVFIGFATPGFWLALLLILLLGIHWPVLPVSGLTSLEYASFSWWGKAWDVIRHLALPVFLYTFAGLASMSRYMRSAMLEVMRQDYILTARAKGLPERIVLFRHAMRNALLPVITLLGLWVPLLIGGSVIIESIFALPGLGLLFYEAILARDYPLVMGSLVLGAVLTLAGNLLADLMYGLADPRVRLGLSPGQEAA